LFTATTWGPAEHAVAARAEASPGARAISQELQRSVKALLHRFDVEAFGRDGTPLAEEAAEEAQAETPSAPEHEAQESAPEGSESAGGEEL
jgi:hypothetical protein